MTPDQALQILDRASSMAALPRQDHVAVQQALDVIAKAIVPTKPEDVIAKALATAKPAPSAAPDPSPCG